MRSIIYWGLYWGPPIYGNYHVLCSARSRFFLVRVLSPRAKRRLGVLKTDLGCKPMWDLYWGTSLWKPKP